MVTSDGHLKKYYSTKFSFGNDEFEDPWAIPMGNSKVIDYMGLELRKSVDRHMCGSSMVG